LAQGAVLVVVLASEWWGISVLGAHALASESASPAAGSSAPIYVAGCPVDGSRSAKGSAAGDAGEGCTLEGPAATITSRRPGVNR
jgi:hypothetical protein